jgi:hypothetical protein
MLSTMPPPKRNAAPLAAPAAESPPQESYAVRTSISKAAQGKLLEEQVRRFRANPGRKVPLMDIARELLEAALLALPPYEPGE